MAQAKKRRRPSAGPPPGARRRSTAAAEGPAVAKPRAPKLRSGEPAPPSYRGAVIRAVIVVALFYPFLIYVGGEEPGPAGAVTAIAFVIMIPFGMLLERMRYRIQMRRFTREREDRARR